jgi:hypothetical protein
MHTSCMTLLMLILIVFLIVHDENLHYLFIVDELPHRV